jgi:hypothetical protein
MYGTDHDIPYLYIRNSAPQDRGEQRPLRDGPIDQDRRRGDTRIVGYYAPTAGEQSGGGLRASGRGSAREKPVRWSSRGMRGGRINDEMIVLPRRARAHTPNESFFT